MKLLLIVLFSLTLYAQSILAPTTNGNMLNMDINSNKIDIKGYENRYIILKFFGKRCPACRQLTPTINRLNSQNNIQAIGIHLQDGVDDTSLNRFLNQKGIKFPVINYAQSYPLYALAKSIAPAWGLQIPFMLFVNRDGHIISYAIGYQSYEQIINIFKTYGSMK
jgi:thiol-disulfide isomerase/thioredoxin